MIEDIRVSIITACYNNEKTITKTLESLVQQDYSNLELIVVDGLSKDKTLSIVRNYENRIREKFLDFKIISEKDNGIADAWNKGLNNSTGEIIFFLNSDDWINIDTITKAVKSLGNKKNAILYGICDRYDINERFIESYQKKFFKYREIWNFGFSFTTCFVPRNIYVKVGGFNNDYRIAIDSEFLIRCVKANVDFIRGNHVVNMRLGGVSLRFREEANKEFVFALRENGYSNILINLVSYIKQIIKRFK